jgi:hypothetical protein
LFIFGFTLVALGVLEGVPVQEQPHLSLLSLISLASSASVLSSCTTPKDFSSTVLALNTGVISTHSARGVMNGTVPVLYRYMAHLRKSSLSDTNHSHSTSAAVQMPRWRKADVCPDLIFWDHRDSDIYHYCGK